MNQQSIELNGLFQTLDELVRVYRVLLETLRREREILISSHLDDLNENNRTKEAILVKVTHIEEQRIAQAQVVHTQMGLGEETPRLLEIARHLGGEAGDRLRNIHAVLEILLKRVQELNRENELLVRSALNHVTGAMKALCETLQDKSTYQRKGEVGGGSAPTGQLVSREA